MSKDTIPPPLLGALMRLPVDEMHRRIIEGLHEHGYTDLVPAHMAVLRYPGPRGQRPVELAAEANMSKQAMNYLLGELERRSEEHTSELQSRFDLVCRLLLEKKKKKKKQENLPNKLRG